MTVERLDYLHDIYMGGLIDAVNGFNGDYTNDKLENLDREYSEIVDFIINGDSDTEIDLDTEKLYKAKFHERLIELTDALCNTFSISVKFDNLFNIIETYKLFMINRYNTISAVLVDQVLDVNINLSNLDEAATKLIELAKQFRLKDLMEDYYLSKMKRFHDIITFESPSQMFIDSFIVNIDEIYNSEVLFNAIKTMLLKVGLRQIAK